MVFIYLLVDVLDDVKVLGFDAVGGAEVVGVEDVLEGLLAAVKGALGRVRDALVLADLQGLLRILELTDDLALVGAHVLEVSHLLLGRGWDYLRHRSRKGPSQISTS